MSISTLTSALARGPGGRVSTTESGDAMSIARGVWREHRKRRMAWLAALHDAELRDDFKRRASARSWGSGERAARARVGRRSAGVGWMGAASSSGGHEVALGQTEQRSLSTGTYVGRTSSSRWWFRGLMCQGAGVWRELVLRR